LEILKEKYETGEISFLLYYFFRYGMNSLLIDGQVEGFVGILDFGGMGLMDFPLNVSFFLLLKG
jgi:hypothetical protein